MTAGRAHIMPFGSALLPAVFLTIRQLHLTISALRDR
jgi:hypothetical protein